MTDPLQALLSSVRMHQGGLLLDTNVLLLHLMVRTDPAFVPDWKLTQQFTESHVILLRAATTVAQRLVTTPHVLTEVTDLADQGLHGERRDRFWDTLRDFAGTTRERYVEAKRVARDDAFSRLGLADLVPAHFRERSRPVVLTVDADLYSELAKRRLPVENLNHYAFTVAG